MKNEEQTQVKTRKEKLKELYVTGTRVFSGPVEKILKWNKALQDIEVMVLYEVVGKCVSVRSGERGAKNLVVRDESGPAIQVLYYEIDFVLPELTLPCTVRIVGRMLSCSSRLQAFSMRAATADDVTTLPRRTAVATQQINSKDKFMEINLDYPEGNQIISLSTNRSGNTFTMPQNMYYSYGPEAQGHMPQMSSGLVVTPAQTFAPNLYPHQGQIVSGIDPYYLAAYSDNNSLLTTGYESQSRTVDAFGVNYQNRNFVGPERNDNEPFVPQRTQNVTMPASYARVMPTEKPRTLQQKAPEVQSTPTEINLMKNEEKTQVKTRKEKLKELYVTGTRVFSGPVEKILKWNKALQDIEVMVLYEVVGKCVSVRSGERGAKNLVVRDESGPAIQVLYYEIDFVLPELTLPCTVRVVGRMLSCSSRLQAFSMRAATADDVTTLPRRTAVATQQVTKLCEEYGA